MLNSSAHYFTSDFFTTLIIEDPERVVSFIAKKKYMFYEEINIYTYKGGFILVLICNYQYYTNILSKK